MTTKTFLEQNRSVRVWEELYIKRRYANGYEASWYDITDYLLDSSVSIEKKLDFESFGYGEFQTSTAEFTLNNLKGQFNSESELYSLFNDAISRHYTKVLYKAGYFDTDGSKIDETVFNGLVNEKTFNLNFNTGELNFAVFDVQSAFSERSTASNYTGSDTFKNVIATFFDSFISEHITYNASKINPETDILFDDISYFNDRIMSDVLTDMCKKANSIWYVDSSLELVVSSREMNVNTPFVFLGGATADVNVNILSIDSYDNGFTKIINQVKYTSGSDEYITSAGSDNLDKYGTNMLELSGEDITNSSTIQTISENIISKVSAPRKRIILQTVYMPNVINLLDECKIEYKAPIKTFINFPVLVINIDNINDDKYVSYYENRLILDTTVSYVYFGFKHNVKSGTTTHYLMENW